MPVAVGTGDDFSTPLGAGVVAPGIVAVVLGTAEVVGALHGAAGHRPRGLVETHGYRRRPLLHREPGLARGRRRRLVRDTCGCATSRSSTGWPRARRPAPTG